MLHGFFNALCNRLEADQAAVTMYTTDGEIGGLTICDPSSQAEVHALRDLCEELADDVRAFSTLVHALRGRSSRWEWLRMGCALQLHYLPHTITHPPELHAIIPHGAFTRKMRRNHPGRSPGPARQVRRTRR